MSDLLPMFLSSFIETIRGWFTESIIEARDILFKRQCSYVPLGLNVVKMYFDCLAGHPYPRPFPTSVHKHL